MPVISSLTKLSNKHYEFEEDELLDEVDQHERDMNEMMKYLNEIEDMMKGG